MEHTAKADEHSLAMECRASLANAAMMGPPYVEGVRVAFVHVAHALWMADERFDQGAFYAECGLSQLTGR